MKKKNPAQPKPKASPVNIKAYKQRISIVVGLLLILCSLVMTISLLSYLMNWKQDQSQVSDLLNRDIRSTNLLGKLGDRIGQFFMFDTIGIASLIICFLVLMLGAAVLRFRFSKPWKILSHSLFFICWLPILMGAIFKGEGVMSGVYGFQIYDYLTALVGFFGVWVIIFFSLLIYFILEFNLNPSQLKEKLAPYIHHIKQSIQGWKAKTEVYQKNKTEGQALDARPYEESTENSMDSASNLGQEEVKNPEENPSPVHFKFEEEEEEELFTFPTAPVAPSTAFPNLPTTENFSPEESIPSEEIQLNLDVNEPAPAPELELQIETPAEESTPPTPNVWPPEERAAQILEKSGPYDHKLDLSGFRMPTADLLKDYGNENIQVDKTELEANKNRILSVLRNFGIGIAEIKATVGPTVTLYEIVPEAGIRVSQIKKLQDDIALSLSALGIRIIAPMPGKGTIGIEVPNQTPSMVSMRSVVTSSRFQNADMDLPIVFGKTISNDVFVADLAKMPHLLMAGATGQGKSVGINAILASLLYKKHPSEIKFVLVDPKKVELSLYSKIERHYLAKLPDSEEAIITDNSKVVNTLNSLCLEMDNRYELLKAAFCKNIKEYNQKFSERRLNPEDGHRYLPYIVLVVDEFADLIMTAGKEVELPIARLAQLARAIGIHLIVATQRPSVNVITGMIKANFPARVAFRVISAMDSKTILDGSGAEQLIGRGDMLYFNGNDTLRLQCAFIDTPEVERVANFIGEQKAYPEAYALPEYTNEGQESNAGSFDANKRDAMFEEAARIVVSTQQGSTSMLQRQLKLGYNRAGRIMDQLEASGVVGPFNGSKTREVLILDLNALERFLEDLKSN